MWRMCRRYRGTLSCAVRASGGEAQSHLSCVRVGSVPSLGGGLEAKNILFFGDVEQAASRAACEGKAVAEKARLWGEMGGDMGRYGEICLGSCREGAPVVRAKVEPPQGLWHVRRLTRCYGR